MAINWLHLCKKRKEEILCNKEQSTVQSTEQPSVQSTVHSNYVFSAGIIAVVAIVVCVFFAYNTFQPKKLINEKKDRQNDVICFRKIYNK